MFRAILYTQWKWTRLALLPCVVIAFALPILSVRLVGPGLNAWLVLDLMRTMTLFSVWYPALAAAAGLIVAVSAWREDHRDRHAYGLSLPVERWRFVLFRFAAGAVLLAALVIAMWLGALIGSAAASIPPGLRAYPGALAARFALAVFVAYAIFFAISAGTTRTAGIVLGGIGALAALALLLAAAGVEVDLMAWLYKLLVADAGPLAVFTGPWVLIDV